MPEPSPMREALLAAANVRKPRASDPSTHLVALLAEPDAHGTDSDAAALAALLATVRDTDTPAAERAAAVAAAYPDKDNGMRLVLLGELRQYATAVKKRRGRGVATGDRSPPPGAAATGEGGGAGFRGEVTAELQAAVRAAADETVPIATLSLIHI